MMVIVGIGLNSLNKESVRKIILAGADVLRYNFSYRTIEENILHIKNAQEVINDLNASTKIMIDMPLNKERLGDFDIKIFAVRENEEFIFQSATYSPDCNQFIPVNASKLGKKTSINQTITIGDGEIAIQVIEILDSERIKCKILNNGTILYNKVFNIKNDTSQILQRYEDIIKRIGEIEFKYIAYSYINEKVNEEISELISTNNHHSKYKIIKIEKFITEEELVNICQNKYLDLLMIDRGEIGVNMPFEKSAVYQKTILRVAKKYQKPIIVSTQILESTINNLTPYRSEISDLTNMVIDGVYGIMLCHETAIGLRPTYSIRCAKKIINEAEQYKKLMGSKLL